MFDPVNNGQPFLDVTPVAHITEFSGSEERFMVEQFLHLINADGGAFSSWLEGEAKRDNVDAAMIRTSLKRAREGLEVFVRDGVMPEHLTGLSSAFIRAWTLYLERPKARPKTASTRERRRERSSFVRSSALRFC